MLITKKLLKFLLLSFVLCAFFTIFVLCIHLISGKGNQKHDINIDSNPKYVNSFGMSEYECSGSCVCEDDLIYDDRRNALPRISTVILAASSLVAFSMAKEWLVDECSRSFFGEECLYVNSEIDSCDRVEDRVWSTISDEEMKDDMKGSDENTSPYISICTEHEDEDDDEKEKIQNLRRKLLFEYLDSVLKDEHVTHDHLAAFTCEIADEVSHHLFPTDEKQKHFFLKNLFLFSKKDNIKFLVIAHEHTKIRMNHVSRELGLSNKKKRLRFGDLDDMMNTLMIGRGSCTGFALFPTGQNKVSEDIFVEDSETKEKIVLYKKEQIDRLKDLKLIIDSKLLEEEEEEEYKEDRQLRIVLHPLMNTASTSITQEDFLRFLKSCDMNEDPIVYEFEENKVVKTL